LILQGYLFTFNIMEPIQDHITLNSIFVRERNALMIRADFSSLFAQYYLHLSEYKLKATSKIDHLFKDCLAGFSLHLVARPWKETHAWTLNLRAPRLNMFLSGTCVSQQVVGRVFTEDIKEAECNVLYAQVLEHHLDKPKQSVIELDYETPLSWIESYYEHSEQRPCRVFWLGEDNYVLIAAQPDCDLEWLKSLDVEAVKNLDQTETLHDLEKRQLAWHCGCSVEKLLPLLSMWKDKLDELFIDGAACRAHCPRCAAHYLITRDKLEAFFADDKE